MCEELSKLKAGAISAFAEAKRVRRYKDLSFHEDAELSCEGYRRIDALIKHLLAGHDGQPCPDGERPIVRTANSDSTRWK
jgi:hypothetical protein